MLNRGIDREAEARSAPTVSINIAETVILKSQCTEASWRLAPTDMTIAIEDR